MISEKFIEQPRANPLTFKFYLSRPSPCFPNFPRISRKLWSGNRERKPPEPSDHVRADSPLFFASPLQVRPGRLRFRQPRAVKGKVSRRSSPNPSVHELSASWEEKFSSGMRYLTMSRRGFREAF